MFSHFVAYSRDKFDHPEFFCWAGAWMSGSRVSSETQKLFLAHLSLYSDQADNDGIFPRNFPGKDPGGIRQTFNAFYASNLMYDLTNQWVLHNGEFGYDYSWLSQEQTYEDMAKWAKDVFRTIYGVSPDEFDLEPFAT
jgi:hypothetical protein